MSRSLPSLAFLLALGLAAGPLASRAFADKPTRPVAADDKKKKPRPAAAPSVWGVVESVNAPKKSITVNVPKNDGTKDLVEMTFALARDAKVTLDEPAEKGKAQPAGKLEDLAAGTYVTVRLSADKKSAVGILARGPVIHGVIEKTDPDKDTLTIRYKTEQGPDDLTLTAVKQIKIVLTDGLTKKDKVKTIKLSELEAETTVQVQVSTDRKRAIWVTVRGDSLLGNFKSYDEATSTLTITTKEDGNVVDKELKLVKNARIEGGKLKDLQGGELLSLTMSVFDKKNVATVRIVDKD